MAWTNWGFDGTINEAQWSQMAGLLGNGYVAAGNGDCLVTAVGGARSVSVAAGTLYGDGVVSVNSAAETVAMTTPVNGQWYLICLKREWATNTATLRAVAGATTTTTTPTVAPSSFPTINTSPGVLTDQPIAWAWCNSANTTVVVFDLRLLPMRTQPVSVANEAKRDAKFPTPVQGNQVWREDLGATETYYALYNVSTNPGGRSAAGWYQEPIGRVMQTINASYNTEVYSTSTSFVTTGLTATITPKSSTSKILVIANTPAFNNGSASGAVFTIFRGTVAGTNLGSASVGPAGFAQLYGGTSTVRTVVTLTHLDSPATASAVTYTIGFAAGSSGCYSQAEGRKASITLMEIAA